MYQYYKIAGLTVKMDTFGRTRDLAFPYAMDPKDMGEDFLPDITVESNYRYAKHIYPNVPDEALEYLCSGRDFYRKLLDYDGILLHASAVAVDGKAYLFSADSGVGKSTHTGLWRQVLGDEKVRILNDDKPALRLEDGVWYAYGTPWSGKYGMNLNVRYPLGGICFLEQGSENQIELYGEDDLIFRFMKQTLCPKGAEIRLKILEQADRLLTTVPVWKLTCNMDREAAVLSYEMMTGNILQI